MSMSMSMSMSSSMSLSLSIRVVPDIDLAGYLADKFAGYRIRILLRYAFDVESKKIVWHCLTFCKHLMTFKINDKKNLC